MLVISDGLRRHQDLLSAAGISLVLHYALLIFAGQALPEPREAEPAARRVLSLVIRETSPSPDSPVAGGPPRASSVETLPAEREEPETSPEQAPKTATPDPRGILDIGVAGYLPAEALSVRPRFQDELADFIPAISASLKSGKIVFTIYISEQGVIDRVDTDAPPELQELATRIEALVRAMPIRPGEIEGHPARSRWMLEFSAEPIPFKAPEPFQSEAAP
ncbi:hypothetical protein [Niveibacterium sp. SC-1]|uniref:hypothetical protein n=1 Tax=Niveibacterium sp. SC-1 TaxID=3135646 RepID=UPI00311F5A5A